MADFIVCIKTTAEAVRLIRSNYQYILFLEMGKEKKIEEPALGE